MMSVEDPTIVLMLASLLIVGFFGLLYVTQVYTLLPGWGPIRRFDADGGEDLRINQLLLRQHLGLQSEAAQAAANQKGVKQYGTLGPSTWGTLEAPWQRPETHYIEGHGEVTIQKGFSDTQWLRSHSSWWARDEPHFMQEAGVRMPELTINAPGYEYREQKMVV